MSTIAGAFTETQLLNLRKFADDMMFDDRIKNQFVPQIATLDAIQAAQTATVLTGRSKVKDQTVEVMWSNFCDYSAEDNTTCVIGGTKSSTNTVELSVTHEKVVNFTFDEADFIDNEMDVMTEVAKGFIKADKELVENFAQYGVAQIDAFAGVNDFAGGKGTVVGTDTYIESTAWNAALVAYFQRCAILNKFGNPLYLSGNNLYEQIFVANQRAGDSNGKGEAQLYSNLKMYFDLFNVDTINTPALKTYMIQVGALAMGNKYYNPEIPQVLDPFTRWRIPSRFVPNLWYDVFYKTVCTTNDFVSHNFKVKMLVDIWNNPAGCNQTNTGVLSFICGDTP